MVGTAAQTATLRTTALGCGPFMGRRGLAKRLRSLEHQRWWMLALCGSFTPACAGGGARASSRSAVQVYANAPGEAAEPATGAEAALEVERKPTKDSSRCEHEGRNDREVVEFAGTGSMQPSIRRVYRLIGDVHQPQRVLACREIDTNLDGIKDVVRRYDEQGQPLEEIADANYDGVIDTWIRYVKGQIAQVEIDDGWDGQPDETRHYTRGKLARIERDTNHDGKSDVWEIYLGGHLDRMGVDLNYDGRVDRWSRDKLADAAAEQAALQQSVAAQETPAQK